ncbi:hypothetical protein [Novosphingobium sp.]|uniref:hypothetical protein n=1 Tax=Novosphingobium sp. TaxID=1874826 RepID=UPI0035B2A3CA
MRAEQARLRRLQRLERVRAIAKQSAAVEAAQAEGTLAQLEALAERTRALTDDYRRRSRFADGLELRQTGHFVAGLQAITRSTTDDARRAKALADRKQQELAQAERSRAAVEDRALAQEKAIAARAAPPVLGARKAIGTGLE